MGKLIDFGGREVDDKYAKAGGDGNVALPYARWVGSKVDYRVITAAATTDVVDLEITIPANGCVHACMYNLITKFETPTTLSDCALIIGDAADPDGIVATIADLDDNGGTVGWYRPDITALGDYLYDATKKSLTPWLNTAAAVLECTFTLTGGGNCSTLTQGEMDIFFLVSSPGAAAVVNRATNQ